MPDPSDQVAGRGRERQVGPAYEDDIGRGQALAYRDDAQRLLADIQRNGRSAVEKYARELDGYHTTEEDGRTLDLFPISEPLRYRLPFSPAADVVAYLEGLADDGQAAA